MAEEEAELDLATLPDDELVKQMYDDLYDGLAPEIHEGTVILLDRNGQFTATLSPEEGSQVALDKLRRITT